MDNRVRVGVRIRPMVSHECENGAINAVQADKDGRSVHVNLPARKNNFDFDWVFPAATSQQQVYDALCKPLVNKIYEGFNATVFAYGQTGSGKTFTMGNTANSLQGDGIITLAMKDIFHRKVEVEAEGGSVEISLSYIEVYMEECYDLLNSSTAGGERSKLDLRETNKGETVLEGLTQRSVSDIYAVSKYLADAAQFRSTSGTAMNAHSSRSHAICTLSLRTTSTDGNSLISKLHLVDLAGSERAKKTMATGDVFQEGVSINKSLFALGNVVAALAKGPGTESTGNANFIPYRESKLTRLLKDALGGNGLTVMLACVSPADINAEETINTLRFASRASSIVNTVKVNHDDNHLDNEGLKKEISLLRTQIDLLQTKCQLLSMQQQPKESEDNQLAVVPSIDKSIALTTKKELAAVQHANHNLLHTIYMMTLSFKSILVACLEEGVPLDDDQLDEMKINISNVYKDLKDSGVFKQPGDEGRPSDASMDSGGTSSLDFSMSSESLDFLPPIVSLIDRLSSILLHLSKYQHQRRHQEVLDNGGERDRSSSTELVVADTCDDDPATDSSDASSEHIMQRMHECDEHEALAAEGIQLKQLEINQMIDLTEKFEVTIAQLKSEINTLQADKSNLIKLQNSVVGSTKPGFMQPKSTAAEDAKANEIRKELRDKSKILEDKLKELKLKESEYSRVMQQKDRLSKEAEMLHKEVEESKKKRAELMRKMKEEGSLHLAEKQKLQHAEIQSRRRELQAQVSLQGLKTEFDMKEKVLKGQLAARERESKQLKELMEKQSKVKSYREGLKASLATAGHIHRPHMSSAAAAAPSAASSAAAAAAAKLDLPLHRATELKAWISSETETQSLRSAIADEVQRETELRSRAARQLQSLRTAKGDDAVAASAGDGQSIEIKMLEEEVRRRSVKIAQKHSELGNLGAVLEKKRFANIGDMKEAKFILEWMFEKITRDNACQKKSLENKVHNQRNQIDQLKRQIASLTSEKQMQLQLEEQQQLQAQEKAQQSSAPINAISGSKRKVGADLNDSFTLFSAAPPTKSNNLGRKSLSAGAKSMTTSTSTAPRVTKTIDLTANKLTKSPDEESSVAAASLLVIAEDDAPLLLASTAGPKVNVLDLTVVSAVSATGSDDPVITLAATGEDSDEEGDDSSNVEADFEETFDIDLDETFYADDDDDEDYDPDEDNFRRNRSRNPRGAGPNQPIATANRRVKDNAAMSSQENSFESEASDGSEKPKKRIPLANKRTRDTEGANQAEDNLMNILANGNEQLVMDGEKLNKPLSKCTVKELKTMLSGHGLLVSGLKEDLVKRLVDFYLGQAESTALAGRSAKVKKADAYLDVTGIGAGANDENAQPRSSFGQQQNQQNQQNQQRVVDDMGLKRKRILGTTTILLSDNEESFSM